MKARERAVRAPPAYEGVPGDVCIALNELLATALAAERRGVASSGQARAPALRAELVLRAAEHAGDAERLHAALVLLRCTPHAPGADAAVNDPLWSTPALSQPDDAALLRGCIAEEAGHVARCENALNLPGVPETVRRTIELCRLAAQRRSDSLRRLLATR